MIIGFRGRKGSGKSTAADLVRSILLPAPSQLVAFADPIKEFVGELFAFDGATLDGPSELRDRPQEFTEDRAWQVYNRAKLIMPFKLSRWSLLVGRDLYAGDAIAGFWLWLSSVTDHEEIKRGVITPRRVLQTFGTEYGRKHFGPAIWYELAFARAARFERDAGRSTYTLIPDARFDNEIDAIHSVKGKVIEVVNIELPHVPVHDLHESEKRGAALSDFEVINKPSAGRAHFREELAPIVERITRG